MTDITGLTSLAPVLFGAAVYGYLLGSIPFGLILAKLAGLGDVRKIGSGNIGATNVLRTGSKWVAAATLLGDLLKGTIAVLGAKQFGIEASMVAGFAALLGHCFPIWLKFKGGKGVATYIGVLLAFSFTVTAIFAVVWIVVAFISRYSSLSALLASAATFVALYIIGLPHLAILFLLLTLILWFRHRENISRLLAGTESRIGK